MDYWGFSTQNFIAYIPPSPASARNFLSDARLLDLQWIELRDPDAVIAPSECRDLALYAQLLGLEVNYTVQRGLLAEDLAAILPRAIENTACFNGPRTLRLLALRGEDAYGWSEAEFKAVLKSARKCAHLAQQQGISLSIENADVALLGKPGAYRGMDDLFAALSPLIRWQCDTANLFLGPVAVTPRQAAAFIRRFAARVSYLHLKTAVAEGPLPILADNPLDFSEIFKLLAEHKRIYVAIELASDKSLQAIRNNMQASLAYLREKGLLGLVKK